LPSSPASSTFWEKNMKNCWPSRRKKMHKNYRNAC
jgi:hypothetical protein